MAIFLDEINRDISAIWIEKDEDIKKLEENIKIIH